MRHVLDEVLRASDAREAAGRLEQGGVAIADEDAMSQAIHRVYCGVTPDHQDPSEKDRTQAREILQALWRESMTL
jgi:hypothetical protein